MDETGGYFHRIKQSHPLRMGSISYLLVFFLLALAIAACQSKAPYASRATVTVVDNSSMELLEPSTTTPISFDSLPGTPPPKPSRPTSQPSPTQLLCWQAGGRIERSDLEVDYLPQPLQFRVYLPPCYDEIPTHRYPVLYLIHGQSFNDDQWQRLGAPDVLDRLCANGEIPPFIIVMPRDRLWLEPRDDLFGQAVVEALVPYIDANYRSLSGRDNRAVGGLSRGGAWALHLGLSHGEVFGAIGMHSGFVFQSDVGLVKRWLEAIPTEQMPRLYLDIGDNDRPEIVQSAAWFERLLTERGIAHEWYMFPGEHDETYWQAHVEQYLRWYAGEWK